MVDPHTDETSPSLLKWNEGFEEEREGILRAKEAELRRRVQEVKRKEDAAARARIVIEEKNWPPFFPIIHHDIANDIPVYLQRLQYFAFASFLGLVLCLLWNVVAVTGAWIRGGGVMIWLLAVFYFVSGVPGAYENFEVFQVSSLYCRDVSSHEDRKCFEVRLVFSFYLLHIGIVVFAAVAPPVVFEGKSLVGILQAIDLMSRNITIGILYFVGFTLFCLESLLSIWVFQHQVYMYFRGIGKAAEMKREAARSVARAAL